MRHAVISDVHSNLEALRAVLSDIKKRGLKDILFLGDAVGYGPDPDECVRLIKKRAKVALAGNHDWAVLGLTSIEGFNPHAKAAVRWTDEVMKEENRKALEGFSIVKVLEEEDALLVHAHPFEPEEWHYLFDPLQAAEAFPYFSQRLCLVGHSHYPFISEKTSSGEIVPHEAEAGFARGSRYVINVGSVGQPRDGDPRACYAVLEEKGVLLVRVEYDVRKTQQKMADADLPEPLIARLEEGR